MRDEWVEGVIADLRGGQTEESWLELKEAWWDLKIPKARAEFLKDVVGLANADCDPARRRVILVGVHEDGRCSEARMPTDEAHLQQALHPIDPVPTVHFRHIAVDGTVITVVEVRPPFDRPYVVLHENRNIVFVRMGSRVGTATRRHLDRMYAERSPTLRAPDLYVDLEEDADPVVVHAPLPNPHEDFLERLRADISEAEQLLRDDQVRPEEKEKLGPWIEQARRFASEIEDPEQHRRWRMQRLNGTAVRLRLHNDGDLPATNISVRLELPDWLVPSNSASLGDRYEGPDLPSLGFLHELMYDVEGRRTGRRSPFEDVLRAMAVTVPPPLSAALGLRLANVNAPKIDPHVVPWPKLEVLSNHRWLPSDTSIDVDGQVVMLRRDQLPHRHEWTSEEIWLFAMEGAPAGDHELVAEVFAEELRDWVTRRVVVRVE